MAGRLSWSLVLTGDVVVGVLAATADGIGGAGVGYLYGGVGELIYVGTHLRSGARGSHCGTLALRSSAGGARIVA